MNTNTSRRAAASCGALALLLGVGALVPLSAQASGTTIGGATTGLGSAVSGVGSAVGGVSSALAGTPAPSASTGVVGTVVTTVASTTSTAPTNAAAGSSTSVLGVVDVNTGSAATPSSGVVSVPGVVSVGSDLLGGTGSGTGTGTGTGTGSAGGTGGGGITVSLGNGADGGSLATVGTGGSAGTSGSAGGTSTTSTTSTTTSSSTTNIDATGTLAPPAAGGSAGTSGSAGGTPTTSTTTNSSTTTSDGTGTPAVPAPTAAPTGATPAAAAPVRLVGLGATPSIGTVYPVKDGYRDDVVFHIASRTSSTTSRAAITGSAVLMRGTKAITQWSISQPMQDLRWNGLDHGKLVPGDYLLSATVQDAAGTTHSTTARVVASAKRLVPSVQRVNALSTTGTHTMAAAARAGLSTGTVTLRLTTVATKVVGKHFLVFVKGAKQFRVPITRGTHTTKAVVVPKAFTSYTLKHTWKKGQVTLKSIRYTYSYQSLR